MAKSKRARRCSRGHAFNKANTYVSKDGRRSCRICRALNYRTWVEQNRQRRRELDRDSYHQRKGDRNA
jgi:hypothetical protein